MVQAFFFRKHLSLYELFREMKGVGDAAKYEYKACFLAV